MDRINLRVRIAQERQQLLHPFQAERRHVVAYALFLLIVGFREEVSQRFLIIAKSPLGFHRGDFGRGPSCSFLSGCPYCLGHENVIVSDRVCAVNWYAGFAEGKSVFPFGRYARKVRRRKVLQEYRYDLAFSLPLLLH